MLLAAQKKTALAPVLRFDLFEFLQGFEYLLKKLSAALNAPKEEREANVGSGGRRGERCEKWGLGDEKMSSCLQWRQEGVEGNKAN